MCVKKLGENFVVLGKDCIFVAENENEQSNMANVATMPAPGQILVNIEDMSMLKDIRKAISMLKGVGKITLPRRQKLYSSYELSMLDLKEGRVYEVKDVDELFKECLE